MPKGDPRTEIDEALVEREAWLRSILDTVPEARDDSEFPNAHALGSYSLHADPVAAAAARCRRLPQPASGPPLIQRLMETARRARRPRRLGEARPGLLGVPLGDRGEDGMED